MNGSNYVTDCHMMTQALKVYASFAGFDKYYASLKENKNQDNRLSSKRRTLVTFVPTNTRKK